METVDEDEITKKNYLNKVLDGFDEGNS